MKLLLYGKQGLVGFALVDRDDYERQAEHRWNLLKGGYAYRRDYTKGRPGVVVYLHRVVMGLKKGDARQVDHVNRNRLDCRKRNLRIVKPGQQSHNMMRRGNFTSELRGVAWDTKTNKWVAYVHVKGRKHMAGYFISERQAGRAAKALRLELLSHAVD